MDKNEQRAHIESLVKESVNREKKAERIQELYTRCISLFSEQDFEELIRLLEEFTLPWVCDHLRIAECYNDEDEHTVMQEARIAVWKTIINTLEKNNLIENFAYYAFGIYKNRTRDCIRKEARYKKKYKPGYIEEPHLPPNTDDYGEKEEKRKIYGDLFKLYCISLLNSRAFPPRCLALYYARVLPHLLSEIPDTKGASAKWAFERMDHFTVWALTQESEEILKQDVDTNLAWGKHYMSQLDEELSVSNRRCRLKDIIYTSIYDKAQIEDWSEYMHKVTQKETFKRMAEDKELLDLVKEYKTTDRTLKKFWKSGGERR